MTAHTPLNASEQSLFEAGAYHGHGAYVTMRQQQRLITSQSLSELLLQVILDTEHLPIWHAGFLAGWYTAMCQAGDPTRLPAATLPTSTKVTT